MSRFRNYVFTWNNWTPSVLDFLAQVPCRYIAYSQEVAPTTGTPHLQGFVCFSSAKTLSAVIKLFKGPFPACGYIHQMNGGIDQNVDYINKCAAATERGDRPACNVDKGVPSKERWAHTRDCMKRKAWDEMDDEHYIKYFRDKRMASDLQSLVGHPADHNFWVYGPSGSGKSMWAKYRGVPTEYKNFYIKELDSKWWPDYNDEPVVILDDFAPYHQKLGYNLKRWADLDPFKVEVKGGSEVIRPQSVIVTSQYTVEECFSGDPQTIQAVSRRFRFINKF